jgi:hypothetical protein
MAYDNQVFLDFSRPGKPVDNAFAESFIENLRDEYLSVNWFLSFDDACDKIEEWCGMRLIFGLKHALPCNTKGIRGCLVNFNDKIESVSG